MNQATANIVGPRLRPTGSRGGRPAYRLCADCRATWTTASAAGSQRRTGLRTRSPSRRPGLRIAGRTRPASTRRGRPHGADDEELEPPRGACVRGVDATWGSRDLARPAARCARRLLHTCPDAAAALASAGLTIYLALRGHWLLAILV